MSMVTLASSLAASCQVSRGEGLTSVELLDMTMARIDQNRQKSHDVGCHGPGAKDTDTCLHKQLG